MMNKVYENLCQMLEKEICNIEQTKALTKDSLELLRCITETLSYVKDLMKKEEEKEFEDKMSNRMSYDDMNMSHAQRRDSMGRYMDYGPNAMMPMHNSYDNNSYAMSNDRGYSRDDSRKKMVRKLETLMDDTMSEYDRQAIQNCINTLERNQ